MKNKLVFLVTLCVLLVAGIYALKVLFSNKVEDGSTLNLSITDKAIKVANDNSFAAKDLEVDEGNILIKTGTSNVLESKTTIRIKSCSLNKTMHLDPQTFKVLKFEDEIWCGGIPGN